MSQFTRLAAALEDPNLSEAHREFRRSVVENDSENDPFVYLAKEIKTDQALTEEHVKEALTYVRDQAYSRFPGLKPQGRPKKKA